MPGVGCEAKPQENNLRADEFLRLARVLAVGGISKFKLTGGEPLLNSDVVEMVRSLAKLPGVAELSMTTNGMLLQSKAQALAKAGLKRVTVSLDSLDAEAFKAITRGGSLPRVLAGIEEAAEAGLKPIKINTVLLREWNIHEAAALARWALGRGFELRFIEFMPMVKGLGLAPNAGVGPLELRQRLERELGALVPLEDAPSSTAQRFQVAGGQGVLGFISAVSARFCDSCDRLRLGSDGFLRLCMGHADGVALGAMLRQGASDKELSRALEQAVWAKPTGHVMDQAAPSAESMAGIGG
jgi:cyclic pyranopterin phosphate synthase